MNPVNKALWYVERHFTREITLDEIASAAGVSPFYLTRAFAIATGHSIMRYVRGRRLTEAARVLAQGAPDILTVAVEVGYGSHEAFTRAFRDQQSPIRQEGNAPRMRETFGDDGHADLGLFGRIEHKRSGTQRRYRDPDLLLSVDVDDHADE